MNNPALTDKLSYQEGGPGGFILFPESDATGTLITAGRVKSEEDAKRLVACWNACRTLTTEQIEQIDGLMPAKLAYQVMQRDRERLLSVLDRLIKAANHAGNVSKDACDEMLRIKSEKA
jgi:hypothetical protein